MLKTVTLCSECEVDSMSKKFDYKTPDALGIIPNTSAVGQKYRHYKNGEIYTVTGYAWNGDTDEWHVLHSRADSLVQCSRSLTNFTGRVENGGLRFELVVDDLISSPPPVKGESLQEAV